MNSSPTTTDRRPVLRMCGMQKTFGGTRAVDDVHVDVFAGEVLALLGQNGAGKSTLIKILAGVHACDAGEIFLDGAPYDPMANNGAISFIHQDLGLIEWMTVAENMALAQGFARRAGLIHWAEVERTARAALAGIAPDIDPCDRVQDLTRAEKSLVAIARALSTRAKVVVLDEPTASLPQEDVALLFGVLRRIKAQGIGMIYVSHRLDEIFEISDRLVVMRDGKVVSQQNTCEANPDTLVQSIIGQSVEALNVRPSTPAGAEVVLRLAGVCTGGVGPVSLEVRRGEILGLVGLRGAGQEQIGRALLGTSPISRGEVSLRGVAPDLSSPARAIASGISFVPSDRLGESIAAGLSVQENMFLNPLVSGRGLFDWRTSADECTEATRLGANVKLRPNAPALAIEKLSGGNQQKVVLARWLRIGGDLLVLEEPTAGVDVGAKLEIYRLLDATLAQGLAVLLISTDFEEVELICQRALTFKSGRIVSELRADALTLENLIRSTSMADSPSESPVQA